MYLSSPRLHRLRWIAVCRRRRARYRDLTFLFPESYEPWSKQARVLPCTRRADTPQLSIVTKLTLRTTGGRVSGVSISVMRRVACLFRNPTCNECTTESPRIKRVLKGGVPSRACRVVSRRVASRGANFRALKQYDDTTALRPPLRAPSAR